MQTSWLSETRWTSARSWWSAIRRFTWTHTASKSMTWFLKRSIPSTSMTPSNCGNPRLQVFTCPRTLISSPSTAMGWTLSTWVRKQSVSSLPRKEQTCWCILLSQWTTWRLIVRTSFTSTLQVRRKLSPLSSNTWNTMSKVDQRRLMKQSRTFKSMTSLWESSFFSSVWVSAEPKVRFFHSSKHSQSLLFSTNLCLNSMEQTWSPCCHLIVNL